jgi:ATP-dependent DNA ligase
MSVVFSIQPDLPVVYLPTLYKKSNTGALMQWTIQVEGPKIHTTYGQTGGALQGTTDIVTEGKNLGKKNATTPAQQALAEAEARWKKKQAREGYVGDMRRALDGQTDAAGGIAPMLAQPYDKARKHIFFPCDAQRKYNGIRCIAVIDHGKATLWSRKREQIHGVPHIQAAYQAFFEGTEGVHIFDGELYHHGWSLQKIGGFVRKKHETKLGFTELQHFVYDYPSYDGDWLARKAALNARMMAGLKKYPCIQPVQTITVNDSFGTVKRLHDEWVLEGYEGAILRNHRAPYEAGKRSYELAKLKEFEEQEFEIIGVTEGRGRMQGKAVFLCRTDEGKEFECVAPGTLEDKAEFFRRKDQLPGLRLTVKFLEWTEEGKPSHGVGVAVRGDYE